MGADRGSFDPPDRESDGDQCGSPKL